MKFAGVVKILLFVKEKVKAGDKGYEQSLVNVNTALRR